MPWRGAPGGPVLGAGSRDGAPPPPAVCTATRPPRVSCVSGACRGGGGCRFLGLSFHVGGATHLLRGSRGGGCAVRRRPVHHAWLILNGSRDPRPSCWRIQCPEHSLGPAGDSPPTQSLRTKRELVSGESWESEMEYGSARGWRGPSVQVGPSHGLSRGRRSSEG